MRHRKHQTVPSDQPNRLSKHDLVERLHPSLRTNFTLLPEAGETLTDGELAAIFGGDLSAMNDVLRLVQQVRED